MYFNTKGIHKQSAVNKLLCVLLLNAVFFAAALWLAHPIYNSLEDVNILYMLAGGFGDSPTALVHYNYIFSPLLGVPVKLLFTIWPAVNWYTILLLLAHYSACCIILLCLLGRWPAYAALLFYGAIFFVYEAHILLYINFTSASFVLAAAGLTLLISAFSAEKLNYKSILLAAVFIVAASMFRVHPVGPVVALALPFLFLKKRHFFSVSLLLISIAALIFVFNLLHRNYYTAHISGWQKEERVRSSLYPFQNTGMPLRLNNDSFKSRTSYNMMVKMLPVESNEFSAENIQAVYRAEASTHKMATIKSNCKNWLWINNRLFIVAALILWSLSFFTGKKTWPSSVSLLLIIAGLLTLAVVAKLPYYFMFFVLFAWCVFTVQAYAGEVIYKSTWMANGMIAVLITAGFFHLYREGKRNVLRSKEFETAYRHIVCRPFTLFVVSEQTFPSDKFSVWAVPKNYMLPNYAGAGHFANAMGEPVMHRFGVSSFKNLPAASNVLFWDKDTAVLCAWFT